MIAVNHTGRRRLSPGMIAPIGTQEHVVDCRVAGFRYVDQLVAGNAMRSALVFEQFAFGDVGGTRQLSDGKAVPLPDARNIPPDRLIETLPKHQGRR